MKVLILVLYLFSSSFSSNASGEEVLQHGTPKEVSIFQLLANPENYEGENIVLFGYTVYSRERPALWATKDSYEYFDYRSAVLLINARTKNWQHCHLHYCRIEGQFSVTLNKNLGIFAGHIMVKSVDYALSRDEEDNALR